MIRVFREFYNLPVGMQWTACLAVMNAQFAGVALDYLYLEPPKVVEPVFWMLMFPFNGICAIALFCIFQWELERHYAR